MKLSKFIGNSANKWRKELLIFFLLLCNKVSPIPAGGGSLVTPLPLTFLETIKILVWGYSNFLSFLTNTCPSLLAQSGDFIPTAWVFRHIAWMPYLTFTWLNLYLDLPLVIGFRLLTTLWKAFNKRKPIAQLLWRNSANIFAYINLPRQWLLKT